jgi:hypothetical protein
MLITEQEIARRMELLRLGREECTLLVNCRAIIEEEIEGIVEEFYRLQMADEEIARIIGDAETLSRLHATQRNYVRELFGGFPDAEYVANRLRVGLVHQRIGVDPRLYLAAVRTLKELLFRTLDRRIADPALLLLTRQALDKQLYFDITLVFDAYTQTLVQSVEIEKGRVQEYAVGLELLVAERTRQLEEKVVQLETALATVKKLQGVIPICGVCKKIRDDKESWHQLEQYISEHSDALFSHGLCPECYQNELLALRELTEGNGKK